MRSLTICDSAGRGRLWRLNAEILPVRVAQDQDDETTEICLAKAGYLGSTAMPTPECRPRCK
jgi:hypothetical protein